MHLHADWPLKLRLIPLKALAQVSLQLRVTGLPHLVTDVDPIQINVIPPKPQQHCGTQFVWAVFLVVNSPALLRRPYASPDQRSAARGEREFYRMKVGFRPWG